jgi:FkbM family methyltransferase
MRVGLIPDHGEVGQAFSDKTKSPRVSPTNKFKQMITDRLYRLSRPEHSFRRLLARLVRRLPHRQRVVKHFGQTLFVDPSELSGFYLYYEQEYDDGIFRFLSGRLPLFRWAIDLGANIGIYTIFMAHRCDWVDAFEPDRRLIERLERNLHVNRMGNVTIHAKCISDATGTVQFEAPPARNQGIGKIVERGIAVPSLSLGDFLIKSEHRPLMIKMDIEGAEWLAINGAKDALRSWGFPLSILMEIHPQEIMGLGGTVSELRRILELLGLTVWSIETGELQPVRESSRFWWATNMQEQVAPNPAGT